MKEMHYILEQLQSLLSIDSPTGYTQSVADYVLAEYTRLGYQPMCTHKGSIVVDLGGEDSQNGVLLQTHVDTLGGMVAEIKPNGRLRIRKVGGLPPTSIEGENVRVITLANGIFEGTFHLMNPSCHVNHQLSSIVRDFSNMEIVLDERVANRNDVEKLGIRNGDYVCFEPRTRITSSGYIKSRFLDNKLSTAIVLGYAKYLKEENIVPERRIHVYVSVFEEVGHGASSGIPEGVTEALSIDMGCIGEGLDCTEHQVSICAMDSGTPYSYDVRCALVNAAVRAGLDFSVDLYPHYHSDSYTTLIGGHDVRFGLFGPGVFASHGYERSHTDAIANTLGLLKAYLG
ncbi:MAG: M42 family metallopeptidase [Christensenellales bacterium]|nr:M42 family metallopeptidase [Christensenellales bacterium]